ncbi:MAG: cell envelope integrity protein CreD, partial [Deltaproteobacteria bacterium]|nr:cell envelope integrity protein CreD [Deltaproteobacteria bacterium]
MENLIIALVILLLLAMIVGLAMGAMVLWRKLSPPSKAEGPAYAAPGAGPCGFEREAPSKSPPGEQALEESRGLPAEARGFSPAKIAGPFAPMTPKSRLWSTRLAAVAVLTVLMTIPMLLIGGLVGERRETMLMTTAGLSDEWGPSQTLTGPLLAIPMTMTVESAEMVPTGENSFKKARLESRVVRWALLTPKTLEANQTLAPEMRRRGIYSSLVYTAEADLSGTFALPSASDLERLPGLSGRLESIGWDQARILVGITSSKSLRAAGPLSFGGRQYEFKPGASELPDAPKGFSAEVDLSRGAPSLAFAFKLSFGGSSAIRIAPVADANQIGISSSWPHPSFAGATLPAERSVSENGFSAKWRVPSMARSYQSLRLLPEKADNNEGAYGQPKPQTTYEAFWVGVSLIDPVDGYHRVDRAVKYAMIFISLNFLIFLLWERSLGRGAI